MPMFEYRCRQCKAVFEELIRNAEDETGLVCPACGASEPERRLSACAVRMGVEGGSPAPMSASGGCGSGGFS